MCFNIDYLKTFKMSQENASKPFVEAYKVVSVDKVNGGYKSLYYNFHYKEGKEYVSDKGTVAYLDEQGFHLYENLLDAIRFAKSRQTSEDLFSAEGEDREKFVVLIFKIAPKDILYYGYDTVGTPNILAKRVRCVAEY